MASMKTVWEHYDQIIRRRRERGEDVEEEEEGGMEQEGGRKGVFLLIWLHMKFDLSFVKLPFISFRNAFDAYSNLETSVGELEKHRGSYRKEIP